MTCNFFQIEKNKKFTLVIGVKIERFRQAVNSPSRTSLLKRDALLFVAQGAGEEGVRREGCFVLREGVSEKFLC